MVAKYTTYPCNTAEELWENLNPLNEQNYPKTSKYIFRGQANSCWGLKPSIFREIYKTNIEEINIKRQASRQLFYEWNLLKNFIEFCDRIGLPIPNDSYEFRNQYFDETKTYFPQTVIKNQSLFMNDNLLELIALVSSVIQKCTNMQCKSAPLCNTYLLEISNNPASLFCFNL